MSALGVQVGGGHYKDWVIQPVEFNQKNKVPYCEANVIKYVCRHRTKNGLQDLEKAKHYIDLLIEMEYGSDDTPPVEQGGNNHLAVRDPTRREYIFANYNRDESSINSGGRD